jgi:flagellar protein FlgJ
MSLSIDDSMYSYLTQTAQNASSSASATSVNSSVSSIDENSSEEEMKAAIKDFESYFVEQILKEVKESLEDDDDSSDQMTDYYMGQVGEELADKIVDQAGSRITQTLYEQMCRNYSITPADSDSATADDATMETLATSEIDE